MICRREPIKCCRMAFSRLMQGVMDIIEGVMEYYSQLSIDFKRKESALCQKIKEKILERLSDGKKNFKCLDEENPVYIDEILEKQELSTEACMVKMIFELETQQLIF